MDFELILLILFWIIFYSNHSLLASNAVKDFIKAKSTRLYKSYRLIYNLIAFLTLGLVLYYQFSIPSKNLYPLPYWFSYLGYGFILIGLIIMLIALKGYDLEEFLGTKQLDNEGEELNLSLQTDGLNRVVRHPLYFGIIIVTIGFFLQNFTDTGFVFLLAIFSYLWIGTTLEERKLIQIFGEDYQNYRKKVPRLIPYFNLFV